MAKIEAYKFVNPGGSGKSTLSSTMPRTFLLATNKIGKTVSGLGAIAKDIHSISLARMKNDKLSERVERRRLRRERDQAAEDKLEMDNALMGKGIVKKPKPRGAQKSRLDKLMDSLLGGFTGILASIGKFFVMIGGWAATKYIMEWMANPANKQKLQVFLEKTAFVIKKIASFAEGSVTKVFDGFSALVDKDKSFFGRLKGLGTLLVGIVGLGALLNPFGMMDAILQLLNLDFYRNRGDRGRGRGKSRSTSTTRGKTPHWKKITKTSNNVARRFGKNGSRVYRDALRQGLSESQALKRVKRLANKKPNAFRPPPKSGLTPGTAKTGKVFTRGLQRGMGRGALKFLGPANLKLLKGAFKQTFGRIPIFGAILTGVFSVLAGDPWQEALFKAAGAAIGGALGTLIPIPGIGSLIGMMGGEYLGSLLYIGFMGGGWKKAGKKLREDLVGLFNNFTKMLVWIKNGWTRFYKGIPKFKIPDFPKDPPGLLAKVWGGNKIWTGLKVMMKAMMGPMGFMLGKEVPNPVWMLNLTGNTFPLLHKSFFPTAGSTGEGQVEEGQAIKGEKYSPEEDGTGGGTTGTTQGKGQPIYNKRGRIVGYTGDSSKTTSSSSSAYKSTVKSPFEKSDRQKARHGTPNVRTDKGPEYQNQWWDFLDVFENKKVHSPSTQGWGPLAPGAGGDAYGDFLNKQKPKEEKKRAWWDPRGWGSKGPMEGSRSRFKQTGGKLLKTYPRLYRKQYFLGKVFKGISKAVSGVVKGVGKAVSGIMNSPLGQVLGTVVPVVFPAAAPFIYAAQGISALSQGNIMGAITAGLGAASGFSTHFGSGKFAAGMDKFFSTGIGGVAKGFLQGGIGGAIGGLTGMLPAGMQKFIGGVGSFMQKNPAIAGLIGSIPGIANVPGLSQMFGLDNFGPQGFSPMGLLGNIADNMGFGSIFRTITGMMGAGGPGAMMGGLREMAAELGVDPAVLGVIGQNKPTFGRHARGTSQDYAMQATIEFMPVPMLLEKLVAIEKPVPIPKPVPVPVPQQQQA